MQVQQIMTTNVTACPAGTNLACVVELLWNADVGALPVVDTDGALIGIITDRDIAIALGTRNIPASQMLVDDVMTREVWTCRPTDSITDVMRLMGDAHVRRIPVTGEQNKLCGIVSLNNIALHPGINKKLVSDSDILATLLTICAPKLERMYVGAASE